MKWAIIYIDTNYNISQGGLPQYFSTGSHNSVVYSLRYRQSGALQLIIKILTLLIVHVVPFPLYLCITNLRTIEPRQFSRFVDFITRAAKQKFQIVSFNIFYFYLVCLNFEIIKC